MPLDPNLGADVAVLESRVDRLDKDLDAHKLELKELSTILARIEAKLDSSLTLEKKVLELEQSHYNMKGWMWKAGGLLSGLATTGALTGHKILDLLGFN